LDGTQAKESEQQGKNLGKAAHIVSVNSHKLKRIRAPNALLK